MKLLVKNFGSVLRSAYVEIERCYNLLAQYEELPSFEKFKLTVEDLEGANGGIENLICDSNAISLFDKNIVVKFFNAINAAYGCAKNAERLMESDAESAWFFICKSNYYIGFADGLGFHTKYFSDTRDRCQSSRDAALIRHSNNSGRLKEEVLRLLAGCRRENKFNNIQGAVRFIQRDIDNFVKINSIKINSANTGKNVYNWCKSDSEFANKLREFVLNVGRKSD